MTQYEIVAEFLGMDGRIKGEQEVRFVNQTCEPVDTLTGMLMLREPKIWLEGVQLELTEPKGVLGMLAEYGARIFRIPLDVSIQPGHTRNLQFSFSGRAPKLEFHPDAIAATLFWHPLLINEKQSNSPRADASMEFLDSIPPSGLAVELTVPEGFETAISADQLNEVVLADGRIQLKASITSNWGDGGWDLSWVSSNRYSVARAGSPEGEIRVYYRQEEARQGPFVAEIAARVSAFYADLMGRFPFPYVSLVPGRQDVDGGGGVGPRMLMLHQMHLLPVPGGQSELVWTHRIVAHELGHLYWSDWVRSGRDFNLGLGLGMWIDQQYARTIDNKASIGQNEAKLYVETAAAGHDTRMDQTAEELENAPFDANKVLRHGKQYAIVSMLEYLLGAEKLRGLLSDIVEKCCSSENRLTEERFFTMAAERYGEDLDWFARQWLHTNAVPDYAVGDIVETTNAVRMEVRRLGDATMPVDVLVRTVSGQELRHRIAGKEDLEVVQFTGIADSWREVILDPESRLPDIDRSNNAKQRVES